MVSIYCLIAFALLVGLLLADVSTDLKEEQTEKYNKMIIYVARDWLGIHLSAARPTLEKSIDKQGLYEWQSKSITMYPVELHRAINEYVHKNNSPKVNEVITLEITFNFTEL